MLISLKSLTNYSIHVKEGEIGKIDQFYFDDQKWTIRYVIVETGHWFNREKVLISPCSILKMDSLSQMVITDLTRDQLINSPDIDTENPISRQMEAQLSDYYRWPYYWTGAGIWGTAATLGEDVGDATSAETHLGAIPKNEDKSENHLRSTQEVFGYHVDANGNEFGRVDDFIVENPNWTVRYIVIHLRKWLPSKTVLISREWVESISWKQKKFRVSMNQNEIERSPAFNPNVPLSRSDEELLHEYYDREKYWERMGRKSA